MFGLMKKVEQRIKEKAKQYPCSGGCVQSVSFKITKIVKPPIM